MSDMTNTGTAATGATNAGGDLSGLVASVDGALTSLDPKAGAAAIGQVQQALQGAPGLSGLTGNLTALQKQLSGSAPDGAEIGRLLGELSQQTRDAAGAGGSAGGALQQLAQRLEAAGRQLSGRAD